MPLLKSDLSKFLKRHFLNIDVVHMTTEELLKDTPAEQLLPNISRARYHAVHRSDIARIALIYKYGGVYSDADIILRRKPNFGPKFFTRSGASSLLINAAFAYPKGDSILWNALYELKKTYDPKGYTVMYTHNKVTERFCKSSCDNTAQQFDNNTVNFKCCDMTIVGEFILFRVSSFWQIFSLPFQERNYANYSFKTKICIYVIIKSGFCQKKLFIRKFN